MNAFIFFVILILIVYFNGCVEQQIKNENFGTSLLDTSMVESDYFDSPIQKYFTTKKIIWTFDDY